MAYMNRQSCVISGIPERGLPQPYGLILDQHHRNGGEDKATAQTELLAMDLVIFKEGRKPQAISLIVQLFEKAQSFTETEN